MTGRPVVFLDRDGTINAEVSFLGDPARVALIDRSADAIAGLNRTGFAVVVVTNQSGVARGYFDLAAVERVNAELCRHLAAENARIDAFYVCPHLPEITGPCACRKPGTLLFRRAVTEMGLTLEGGLLVGDRRSDLQAGRALGVRTALVLTGYGRETAGTLQPAEAPDRVAGDLFDAVEWLLRGCTD